MSNQETKLKLPKFNSEQDRLLEIRQQKQFDRRRNRTPYPVGAIGDKGLIKSEEMSKKEEVIQRTFKGEQYGEAE